MSGTSGALRSVVAFRSDSTVLARLEDVLPFGLLVPFVDRVLARMDWIGDPPFFL
jgi:hypothetical protein